ncbi:pentatricopeptide repeat-containing protein At1g52640, mitochondrial-like [Lycium barbarum]|uniref:pentatricopeptide repeat-containing protein At1g52640, mitochondrial-like n=1 Tax=Lycium barbarum TaxID=112863 RepID=UPI00293EB721|nr:pentatricopeptide repeat-containing protein At1g52640, mitochondrial-like [Lycium barbarum]
MLRGWGDLGEVVEARKLFDEMLERGFSIDVLACNSILESFSKAGKMDEAYELFVKMRVLDRMKRVILKGTTNIDGRRKEE